MRVILLTKSGKFGGACVAGFAPETGRLVRFVSEAESGKEIPFPQLQGIEPLDVVEVKTLKECPLGPQSENVLVPPFAFQKVGTYEGSLEDLQRQIRLPFIRAVENLRRVMKRR